MSRLNNNELRKMTKKFLRESSEDDEVSGYDLWQQRMRDDPRPEDKETWDQQRRRQGKSNPVDASPEVLELKDKVLEFIEGSDLGSAQSVEGANRWTVQPAQGIEVDFLIQSKASGVRLKIGISAISDYLPQGSFDGEDASFLADNLVKMSEILRELGESGLPIYDIGFSTRR